MKKKRYSRLLIVPFLLILPFLGWKSRMNGKPDNLGVDADGKLAPCPSSPNCVTTQSGAGYPIADPIPFDGDVALSVERMAEIIEKMPNAKIEKRDGSYLHAVFRSKWMGFADDIELTFDAEAGLIHFRAAARMGYSDLGVNPARMETIRAAFEG